MEKQISNAEIYIRVMDFIDKTNDIELLKNILIESLDNSNDTRIISDAYFNHIEPII